MAAISRNTDHAQSKEYDLIIIGGGIYGAMLALESAANGLKPILIEKADFGGATSFNSLRILHGGLRYLQSMNLPRFFESVAERRWFLRHFPHLAKPMPCLMPLYGEGMRKPSIFRIALIINDILSRHRNNGVLSECLLPNAKIITAKQVTDNFPQVDKQGLKAGALWYDGAIADSQRIIIEILRWANHLGATSLNYVKVAELTVEAGHVSGVEAIDFVSGKDLRFRAPVVINASGPWSRSVAKKFDKDYERLFRSSIAWNVLFDRPALAQCALAVAPKKPGAQTYFFHPWKNQLLIGTGHAPWDGGVNNVVPNSELIMSFIEDINVAIPGIKLRKEEIVTIFSGLLPSENSQCTELAASEQILNHGEHGGPEGFFSISGVKFTTSRLVAQKTLSSIFRDRGVFDLDASDKVLSRPDPQVGWDAEMQLETNPENWLSLLRNIIEDESVIHLDDLLVRRSTVWQKPQLLDRVSGDLDQLFNWDESRRKEEIDRCKSLYLRPFE